MIDLTALNHHAKKIRTRRKENTEALLTLLIATAIIGISCFLLFTE